jgi:SAM-dependent methyltransferase
VDAVSLDRRADAVAFLSVRKAFLVSGFWFRVFCFRTKLRDYELETRNQKLETISAMKILDVGCGVNKTPGAIGLDNNPKTAADVIHDLGTLPYPFPDNEFDTVVSNHAVEHVPDLMGFVSELYRITKPGGRIKLITPHYTNPDWASDPTHRNHINSYTFNPFMPERAVFDFYTDVKLRPVSTYVSLLGLWRALGIEFIVNLDQRSNGLRFTRKFWEHYLSYVFRGKEIFFEFEVVK